MARVDDGVQPAKSELYYFSLGEQDAMILCIPREPEPPASLAIAEADVFACLLRERTASEIAAERGTTLRTVQKQIHAIYRKLGVSSRSELISRAYRDSPEL